MIIISDVLKVKDGLYFLDSELFNGVKLEMNSSHVSSAEIIKNGTSIGSYKSRWLSSFSKMQLDIDTLTNSQGLEPYLYEGKKFTGIGLDFDGHYCVGELLIEDGFIVEEVSYFKSGELAYYEGVTNNVAQNFSLYPDGCIKQFNLESSENSNFDLLFNESGDLKSAVIQGNFNETIEKSSEILKFKGIKDFSFFSEVSGDSYLYLSGSGVTDEILDFLKQGDGTKNIEKIALRNTSLSIGALASLGDFSSIIEIVVDDIREESKMVLEELKVKKNACYIELNGITILN